MKPITENVTSFPNMHGWANRILRVDLSNMRIGVQEAAPYVPGFLGARGIAAKICWDEYPEPVEPFDPANPVMIFPGALTGSRSPYSGRTNLCAFSPQAYPYRWFTRSSVGAHFGGELKRAGYDGIVVTGASETPVRICIRDDEVRVLPADDLWGQDTMDTLKAVEATEGKKRAFSRHRACWRAFESHRHNPGSQLVGLRSGRFWCCHGVKEAEGHLGYRHRTCVAG